MESHVPTASPAARGDYGTCHVAIELSGAGWLVGIHTPLSDKIGVHKLTAGDASGLVGLVSLGCKTPTRRLVPSPWSPLVLTRA